MKTKSFLLGAAALMLAASCSNDEVVNVAPQSGAIGFNSFVGNSTRTDYGTNDTELKAFNVYGVTWGTVEPFQVFSGVKVDKRETKEYESFWSYVTDTEPLRYWIPGNTYTFAAVAPIDAIATEAASGKAVVTQGTNKTYGGISKIQFTNDGNVDLLFDAKDAPNANALVNFELKHLLSRVKFQLNNELESDLYYIEVKNVSIKQVVKNATYTLSTAPAWSVTDRADFDFAVEYTQGENHTANKASAVSESRNLIPEVDAEYEATFTIVLYQEVDGKYTQVHAPYVHTVTLPKVGYKAGSSYLFAANITPENIDPEANLYPIVFSATVKDWEEVDAVLPTQEIKPTTEEPSTEEGGENPADNN